MSQINNYSESTILSAHQPNFLPWLGYFLKINQSHIFVFSDDVYYSKQQNFNRATFLDSRGEEFIWHIPVQKKPTGRIYEKLICHDEVRVFSNGASKIRNEYKKTPFFHELIELVDQIEEAFNSMKSLAEFNIFCIETISNLLMIKSIFLKGSSYGLQNYSANERLLYRAKALGVPDYLCGVGAAGYQNDKWLIEQGMKIHYVNYSELSFFKDNSQYSILHLIPLYGINNLRNFIVNSVFRAEEKLHVSKI
jgi:hypothetical protein